MDPGHLTNGVAASSASPDRHPAWCAAGIEGCGDRRPASDRSRLGSDLASGFRRQSKCRRPVAGCNRITCPGRPGPAPIPKSRDCRSPPNELPGVAVIARDPRCRTWLDRLPPDRPVQYDDLPQLAGALAICVGLGQRHLFRRSPASGAAQAPDGVGDAQARAKAVCNAAERQNGVTTALAALNMKLPVLHAADRRRRSRFGIDGLLGH